MIVEIFYHLLQLDFVWVAELLLGNLHWAFAFFALAFIFFERRSPLKKFLAIAAVPLIWEDFTAASGIVLFAVEFLAVYYVVQIAVLRFAEDYPKLAGKLNWVEEAFTMSLVFLFNFALW